MRIRPIIEDTIRQFEGKENEHTQVRNEWIQSRRTEGKDKSAARLDTILNNLQDLAETHEQKTNEIRMRIDDEELKIRIDENLDEIRQAKIKVRLELRQELQENDD